MWFWCTTLVADLMGCSTGLAGVASVFTCQGSLQQKRSRRKATNEDTAVIINRQLRVAIWRTQEIERLESGEWEPCPMWEPPPPPIRRKTDTNTLRKLAHRSQQGFCVFCVDVLPFGDTAPPCHRATKHACQLCA